MWVGVFPGLSQDYGKVLQITRSSRVECAIKIRVHSGDIGNTLFRTPRERRRPAGIVMKRIQVFLQLIYQVPGTIGFIGIAEIAGETPALPGR